MSSLWCNIGSLFKPIRISNNAFVFSPAEPFKHAESKDYFVTDNIDPDNNLHNTLSVSSLYYTDDQFKRIFFNSKQGNQQFSLIHFNCRSLPSKLKESISALDFKFNVIA